MKIRFPYFLILSIISISTHSKDIRSETNEKFKQCMAATKKDRQSCNFGGCGAIMADCYKQNIELISYKSNELLKSIKNSKCSSFLASADESINKLNENLNTLEPLNGTWSGFEVQKEVALLRLHVIKQIIDECQ